MIELLELLLKLLDTHPGFAVIVGVFLIFGTYAQAYLIFTVRLIRLDTMTKTECMAKCNDFITRDEVLGMLREDLS